MQEAEAAEPVLFDLLRAKSEHGPLLAGEGAFATGSEQDRDGAGRLAALDGLDLHPARLDLRHQPAPELVVADAGDQPGVLAQGGRPGAEIGGLATASDLNGGVAVVVQLQLHFGCDRHVQHQGADRPDHEPESYPRTS